MRAVLAVLIVGVLVAAPAGASRVTGGACHWQVVRNAPGPALWAATAFRGGELWAVGDNGARPWILHRRGGTWRTFASSLFGLDIDAVSNRYVWSVGSSAPGGLQTRP